MNRFLLIGLIVLAGCSQLEFPGNDGRLAVKEIAVTKSGTDGTKARYDEGTRDLYWGSGDKYFYYTYGSSGTLSDVTPGTLSSASGITELIPVTYDSGRDNTVVIGSVGSKVGAVSNSDKTRTTIKIENGIPVVQDGTVEGSYVNIGTAALATQDRAALRSCQAYISFNLLNLTVGGKTVKFFTVQDKSGAAICGTATYTIASGAATAVSGGDRITVNVTAEEQKTYYVAVKPGTYASGFRICLYDQGTVNAETGVISGTTHVCGMVDSKANAVVTAGKVLSLGEVTEQHTLVPATAGSLAVHPTNVNIVYVSDFKQTKKLYLEYAPSDMTDLDFEYNGSATPTYIEAVRGPDEDYDAGSGVKRYMTVNVTPIGAAITTATTERVCTLKIKDKYPAPGTSATYATCIVKVGMFIDLGLPSGTLWAATYMSGSTFATSVAANGSQYAWGWKSARGTGTVYSTWRWLSWANNSAWSTNKPTFTAQYVPTGSTGYVTTSVETNPNNHKVVMTGGLYLGVAEMRTADDVCYGVSTSFRIPSKTQVDELRNTSYTSMERGVNYGGKLFYKHTSKVAFYEDAFLLIRESGNACLNGGVMEENATCTFWTRTHQTGTSSEVFDYGANSETGSMNWHAKYVSGGSKEICAWTYRNGASEVRVLWEPRPIRAVKQKT